MPHELKLEFKPLPVNPLRKTINLWNLRAISDIYLEGVVISNGFYPGDPLNRVKWAMAEVPLCVSGQYLEI